MPMDTTKNNQQILPKERWGQILPDSWRSWTKTAMRHRDGIGAEWLLFETTPQHPRYVIATLKLSQRNLTTQQMRDENPHDVEVSGDLENCTSNFFLLTIFSLHTKYFLLHELKSQMWETICFNELVVALTSCLLEKLSMSLQLRQN